MNEDYEKAYRGIPKVTFVISDQCAKCGTRVKAEGRVPEGVYWDPSLTCGKCGASWVVTVHVKMVEPS